MVKKFVLNPESVSLSRPNTRSLLSPNTKAESFLSHINSPVVTVPKVALKRSSSSGFDSKVAACGRVTGLFNKLEDSRDKITESKSCGDLSDRKDDLDTDALFPLSRSQVRNGYNIRVICTFRQLYM